MTEVPQKNLAFGSERAGALRIIADPPYAAAAAAGLLLVLGLVMIYSATAVPSVNRPGAFNQFHFLEKQVLFLLVGSLAFWICLRVPYRRWVRYGWVALPIAVLLLAAVLHPSVGKSYNGARRWLRFGGFGVQVSDLAKLAVLLYLAWLLGTRPKASKSFWRGTLPAVGGVGVVAGLVAVEPDFGTALFLIGFGALVAVAGGARLRHLLPLAAAGIPPAVFLLYSRFGHIRERLLIFLNPDVDPLGKGLQVRQSLIALGSGGIFGKGIGAGRAKLHFLPENFTDFIFAMIGEEAGLAGTLLILFCFGAFLFAGISIARRARDLPGFIIAYGVTVLICAQAFVNVAVVSALVPPKGISLPFVSYGGSSLVCMMAAVGLLLNVARHEGAGRTPGEVFDGP
jgi:cell division protein FtsW